MAVFFSTWTGIRLFPLVRSCHKCFSSRCFLAVSNEQSLTSHLYFAASVGTNIGRVKEHFNLPCLTCTVLCLARLTPIYMSGRTLGWMSDRGTDGRDGIHSHLDGWLLSIVFMVKLVGMRVAWCFIIIHYIDVSASACRIFPELRPFFVLTHSSTHTGETDLFCMSHFVLNWFSPVFFSHLHKLFNNVLPVILDHKNYSEGS